MKVGEKGFTFEKETHLTVCKTSLFCTGDGFNVYDCKGQLVFRVDSYGPEWRDKDELVLMDASGHCLLTVRRKIPSLHNRWEGYLGERNKGSKPIFNVKRSSLIGRSGVTVEMYSNPSEEYHIEGSFPNRCCTVYDAVTREVVAEIRRKVDALANVVLGKDVFSLLVKPGFDAAFAMGLVLVLDQISEGLIEVLNSGAVAEPGLKARGPENFWELSQIGISDLRVRRRVEAEWRRLPAQVAAQVAGQAAGGVGRSVTGLDRLQKVKERVRGQWAW